MKRRTKRPAAAAMAVLLVFAGISGCAKPNQSSPGRTDQQTSAQTQEPIGSLSSESQGDESEIPAGEPFQELARAEYPVRSYGNEDEKWEADRQRRLSVNGDFCGQIEDFACETAVQLFQPGDGNEIYSPLSLYYALALSASGAAGETQRQILTLLHAEDEASLRADARQGFETFYTDDGGCRFQMANSVWIDQGLSVKDSYLDAASADYFSDIFHGQMGTQSMKTAMENWVQEHTGGLIRPDINADQRILLQLMNTVYYYDEWIYQFRRENTKEDFFYPASGDPVKCDFMNTTGYQSFYRGGRCTISSLSTKNGSVQFLLPDEGVDVYEFLASPEDLKALLEAENGTTVYGEVTWKVPKFSCGNQYDLKDMLTALGMTDAFSPENADFSAMTDTNVWIDEAIQMTHVSINEDGIEAAAYTELGYAGAGMPQDKAEMILDRPFLYVIRNLYSGSAPVFIGICADPTQTG